MTKNTILLSKWRCHQLCVSTWTFFTKKWDKSPQKILWHLGILHSSHTTHCLTYLYLNYSVCKFWKTIPEKISVQIFKNTIQLICNHEKWYLAVLNGFFSVNISNRFKIFLLNRFNRSKILYINFFEVDIY